MATKVMKLRRDDACVACGAEQAAGTRATWDSAAKTVTCLDCSTATSVPAPSAGPAGAPPEVGVRAAVESAPTTPQPEPPVVPEPEVVELPPIDRGDPGRSAREEHDRRKAKREAKLEERWGTGRLGKLAKLLSDDPQTTKAWAQGAAGEERVAQVLEDGLGDRAVLLHDRKVPGTRGNIDHLAITASGVWLIDAKRYAGKVECRDVGGWFRTDLRLYVGGRDRTKTVTGLGWQVEAVTKVLGDEAVPLHQALCFVGAEWPLLFAKPLRLHDVLVAWPVKLAELVAMEGPLDADDIERVARLLATKLPSK